MKKIILMRHGEPELNLDLLKQQRFSPNEIAVLIEQYKTSPLNTNKQPPVESTNIAHLSSLVFCSDIPRSIQSAQRLANKQQVIQKAYFKESDLPHFKGLKPKLSFTVWAVMLRTLWLFGFARNGESIKQAKLRAKTGATELINATTTHDTVLLLGHGIINRLIAKQLKNQGWQLKQKTGISYWSFMEFEIGV